MLKRTWPYGTTRRAKVLERKVARNGGHVIPILVVGELQSNEAHILVGTSSAGEPGDVGWITFLEGGPMGGYWHFEPDEAVTAKVGRLDSGEWERTGL